MKDYQKLMEIHRTILELSSDILEIVEGHYEKIALPGTSEERKEKYKELYAHANKLIEYINQDLHNLVRLDTELKELEEGE